MKSARNIDMNVFVPIQFSSSSPKYLQIAQRIAELIADNTIAKNAALPPIRSLAKVLSVNPVTVVKAYEELKNRHLAYSNRGSGVFAGRQVIQHNSLPVEDDIYRHDDRSLLADPDIVIPKDALNLATTTPSTDLFPVEHFTRSLHEVLQRDCGDAFSYDESGGYFPLREAASSLLEGRYKIQAHPSDIQIISGAQQGIDIAAKALIQPGDTVLVEDPTYAGALAVFASRGARIIPVGTYEGDRISRYCREYRPKIIYCMSDFQNPTSRSLSLETRRAILYAARSCGSYIIEDDYASDLQYRRSTVIPAMKALDDPLDGRVIYIKSFSKILMPGLRIGFLAAPGVLSRQLLQAKHLTDISSSGFIQRSFEHYLTSGKWEEHLAYMIAQYEQRYDACCDALKQLLRIGCSYTPPGGGLHIWLTLPETMSARRLYQQAALKGVLITPGEVFRAGSHLHDRAVRISIAGCTVQEIRRAIAILGEVMTSRTRSTVRPFI